MGVGFCPGGGGGGGGGLSHTRIHYMPVSIFPLMFQKMMPLKLLKFLIKMFKNTKISVKTI